METKIFIVLQLLFGAFSFSTYAQKVSLEPIDEGSEYLIRRNDANNPCITPKQYETIKKEIANNIKLLGLESVGARDTTSTLFHWPMRTANGLNDCSYYYIGNYLDQDTTSPGIRDWNCGSVTYDGHKGTDICTYPYPFYKMDNNQVEIIAAAPGTIINRVDGNFDKNCDWNNPNANYITIQHADGSVAMYWHMKKNSLTTKQIGQTVVAGEYLGVVGSSGTSSAPHLHFEVLSGITINTLNDSYSGPCNSLNANSWWINQKPYKEPAIIEASIHPILAVLPTCPNTETPNEDTCFAAGSLAKFYIFMRNETTALVQNMRIINPNGTTFISWTHTSNNNFLASYRIFAQTLPTAAGTYTFEAVYNGDTCRKNFMINCDITGISENKFSSAISVYPNPFSSETTLQTDKFFKDATLTVYSSFGQRVKQINNISGQSIILHRDNLSSGLYFIHLTQDNKTFSTDKLVITDK